VSDQSQPNVVFIVGDDGGWGDIQLLRRPGPQPCIDGLAAQGLRFKNYSL
jgi:arylsulfatase A-like enzyme